jgi:hypothetical protein
VGSNARGTGPGRAGACVVSRSGGSPPNLALACVSSQRRDQDLR